MKNIILFCICIMCTLDVAYAQTPVNSVSGSYTYTNLSPEQVGETASLQLQLEPKTFSVTIGLGSTSGYTKLAVMLGSSAGSNDVFYKEFEIGSDGNFDDGTSYHTNGNTVEISLGNHSGMTSYYAEVFAITDNAVRSAGTRYTIE